MKPKTQSPGPVLGEYVVDLKTLADAPLSKVFGDLAKPLLLSTLQEKLWIFLQEQGALKPGHSQAKRAKSSSASKRLETSQQ
jgi:hypothetical protein